MKKDRLFGSLIILEREDFLPDKFHERGCVLGYSITSKLAKENLIEAKKDFIEKYKGIDEDKIKEFNKTYEYLKDLLEDISDHAIIEACF